MTKGGHLNHISDFAIFYIDFTQNFICDKRENTSHIYFIFLFSKYDVILYYKYALLLWVHTYI